VGECTVAANQGLTFEDTDLKNVTETENSVRKDKIKLRNSFTLK